MKWTLLKKITEIIFTGNTKYFRDGAFRMKLCLYMVSNNLSICPSVRLLQTLTPIISGLAKQNGLKFVLGHLWQKKIICQKSGRKGWGRGQKIWTQENYPDSPHWGVWNLSHLILKCGPPLEFFITILYFCFSIVLTHVSDYSNFAVQP